MSERDRIVEVMAATRQAIERANAADLTTGDWKVFSCVIDLVASWSRLTDRVYVAQVAACNGLSEEWVRQRLNRLAELEVIVWIPSRGRGRKSLLGLIAAEGQEKPNDGGQKTPTKTPTPEVGPTEETEETSREEPTDTDARRSFRADGHRSADPLIEEALGDLLALLVSLPGTDFDDRTPNTLRNAARCAEVTADDIDEIHDWLLRKADDDELPDAPCAYANRWMQNIGEGYSGRNADRLNEVEWEPR